LVVAIVFGFPFLLAAGANGWIPATVVIYALLGLWLAMPIFMTVDSRRRKQVQDMDREEREAVALRRWAEFEETE
jgi:hypothetical protein